MALARRCTLFLLLVLGLAYIAKAAIAPTATAGPKCKNAFPQRPLCKFVDSLTTRVIPTLDGTKPLTIGAYQIYQKFHRDLPATKQYAYGTSQKTASYPGPTIVAKVGIDTTVTWENHLPRQHAHVHRRPHAHHGLQVPQAGHPHGHGGSQQSFYDGHPFAWITQYGEKGPTYATNVYKYVNDEASTIWYHDHMAGLTRLNVAAGLAGLYIITDPEVESKFTWLPPASRTVPLAIADRLFFANGSVNYPNVGIVPNVHPNWIPEYLGDTNMVNGVVWPYLKVRPAMYRFKMLGAANARFYNLQFVCAQRGDYPNFVPPLRGKIATDGGYLPKPVYSKSLLLVPGARQDVLVDFSNLPDTCKDVILQNLAAAPFPAGVTADRDTGLVMRFVITNRKRFPAPKIPSSISYLPPINYKNIQKVRWHRLVEEMDPKTNLPVRVTIDNLGFADPIRDYPKQGTNELWHIINLSADAHPMHFHLVDHRPVSRRPFDVAAFQAGKCAFRGKKLPTCWTGPRLRIDPTEDGLKDTTTAYPGQVLTLWFGWHDGNGKPFPFDVTVGPGYVYHCHMLDHEDNDMMRPFKVIKGARAAGTPGKVWISRVMYPFGNKDNFVEEPRVVQSENHGWQKVTNVKKQRRQEQKDSKKPSAAGKSAGGKGSIGQSVFSSLEDESKQRRARIEARAAAAAAAEREAERAEYDADDDDDDDEEREAKAPAAAEPKKPKKPKKPKVTVLEAATAIKVDELSAFLVEISESFAGMPDVQLMRCADFFARAFSAVLPSQLNIPKIIRDSSLAKALDEVRTTASEWLAERPADALAKFLVTLVRSALEDVLPVGKVAKGTAAQPLTPPKAKVGMLVLLVLLLRRRPDVMLQAADSIRTDPGCLGQDRLPVLAWMYGQVAVVDLVSGMALLVSNLMPFTSGKQGSPVGRDVTLTYFQTVLLRGNERKARAVLLNGAFRKGERLVPYSTLDQFLRLAFPPASARTKATDRFTALYPLLKDITLAGSGRTKSTKAVATMLLPLMFRAAGEEPEALAQEASSLFVWCLAENPDCYLQWERHHAEDHATSTLLLTYVLRSWPTVKTQLAPFDPLRKFLASIRKKVCSACCAVCVMLAVGQCAGHSPLLLCPLLISPTLSCSTLRSKPLLLQPLLVPSASPAPSQQHIAALEELDEGQITQKKDIQSAYAHIAALEELDEGQIARKKDIQSADATARKLQGKVAAGGSCVVVSAALMAVAAAAAYAAFNLPPQGEFNLDIDAVLALLKGN
ncbi:unnamed protein product [Closterium sp. NIES-65]|nr:unnamed protein product [Closterium sp. NIES-65]